MQNDEIKVYKAGESPCEQRYVEAIQKVYPGWKIIAGGYCPGIANHETYKIAKDAPDGQITRMVHVNCDDLSVTVEGLKSLDEIQTEYEVTLHSLHMLIHDVLRKNTKISTEHEGLALIGTIGYTSRKLAELLEHNENDKV